MADGKVPILTAALLHEAEQAAARIVRIRAWMETFDSQLSTPIVADLQAVLTDYEGVLVAGLTLAERIDG